MPKIAFIFPGQGAQTIGMGRQIVEKYKAADRIFNKASDSLGFDVKKMVFEGDEEELKITENTQPTVLTTSIACLQPILEKGIKPEVVAGLSLGEYTAHIVAGTISFEDAVSLVKKRGKYMQEAVPLGVGGMAAILGLDEENVIQSCIEASDIGVVEAANLNCPGQIVVAGEIKAVEKVMKICKDKGAKRCILLPVSAPFHTKMLKSAGDKLSTELEKISFSDIKIPVVTNVTAEYIYDKNSVMDLLIRQVSSPVLWEKSVRNMLNKGIDTFVEIGPGKALSGFIKKINKDVKILNVEDIESLDKTISELSY